MTHIPVNHVNMPLRADMYALDATVKLLARFFFITSTFFKYSAIDHTKN